MKRQKVLIYSDCYIYGGSERLMCFLLKNELINENFDLSFSYRKHKDYETGLQNDFKKLKINTPAYPLSVLANETVFHKINQTSFSLIIKQIIKIPFFIARLTGLYFLYNSLLFFFFLKKIKPEIIHINNGGYPGAASCNHFIYAAKLNNIKSIIYQVNNIAYKPSNNFQASKDKFIISAVRFFITASAKAKKALEENRSFPSKKIKQIPNTIFVETISKTKTELLQSFNWPDDSFLIVQVGFLTKRKGQLYLIKAIKQIFAANPQYATQIKLVIVGNGEDEKMLNEYIAQEKLNNNIVLAGYRADSSDFIKASDVFVLPSIANEDMPLVLLTAMSFSKPVITTNFAGIGEAIQTEINGILLEPDANSLSKNLALSIEELYNDSEKRYILGKNAQSTFEKDYSEYRYGKRIVNLYQSLENYSA